MTSARRLTANRTNAQRSTGPKSRDGKKRAGANARKHGLSRLSYRAPLFGKEAERMVAAICAGDANPLIIEQAIIIAESELALRMVREQKTATIERLFYPLAVALSKGDRRAAMADIVIDQTRIADYELTQLVQKFEKEGIEYYPIFTPAELPPNESGWRYEPLVLRTEHEALCEALPDLERLLRYERRILARQRKAVEILTCVKVLERS